MINLTAVNLNHEVKTRQRDEMKMKDKQEKDEVMSIRRASSS